ncbi:hypothetical protein EIN_328880 [Entamoeba invadens IP1]|uniref:Rho-GAP domain-containing protein n=1 Tax=Entamoeba invadens IP1 TaxID=370355 RepID=A0A0A1U3M3_ENTIV|nr:hypothetical protein EIN_328880 [Entamoeba invadens IP1]ELP86181.1 hypothetical protein EIN_328880 [Entamoeba invadens IP1]|eukprot:XP_004185527.1 hypothetical protein EIN_328880 [Entamoeba invadens IP1]
MCNTQIDYLQWVNSIPLFSNFTGVFGYPLQSITTKKKCGWRFPLPIYRSIQFLKQKDRFVTEGIFRVSPVFEWLKRVKEQLDSGQDILDNEFGPEEDSVHVAAGIIKAFIREISDGLVPSCFYQNCVEAGGEENIEKRIKKVSKIVDALPETNKNMLWYLCDFLVEILKHKDITQMDTVNLAVCFAPSVIYSNEVDPKFEMDNSKKTRTVFETFLNHYDQLFKDIKAQNIKLGMYPPLYPAVCPTGAVSDKVMAEEVAKASKERMTISMAKRKIEPKRDEFRPRSVLIGKVPPLSGKIDLNFGKEEVKESNENGLQNYTQSTNEWTFMQPLHYNKSSGFLEKSSDKNYEKKNDKVIEKKTETKVEKSSNSINVMENEDKTKLRQLEENFKTLLCFVEQQNAVMKKMGERITQLQKKCSIEEEELIVPNIPFCFENISPRSITGNSTPKEKCNGFLGIRKGRPLTVNDFNKVKEENKSPREVKDMSKEFTKEPPKELLKEYLKETKETEESPELKEQKSPETPQAVHESSFEGNLTTPIPIEHQRDSSPLNRSPNEASSPLKPILFTQKNKKRPTSTVEPSALEQTKKRESPTTSIFKSGTNNSPTTNSPRQNMFRGRGGFYPRQQQMAQQHIE